MGVSVPGKKEHEGCQLEEWWKYLTVKWQEAHQIAEEGYADNSWLAGEPSPLIGGCLQGAWTDSLLTDLENGIISEAAFSHLRKFKCICFYLMNLNASCCDITGKASFLIYQCICFGRNDRAAYKQKTFLMCDFALCKIWWKGLRTEQRLQGTRGGGILWANVIQCPMAGDVLGGKDAFHKKRIQMQEDKRTTLLGTLPVRVNRCGANTSICLPTWPSSTSLPPS